MALWLVPQVYVGEYAVSPPWLLLAGVAAVGVSVGVRALKRRRLPLLEALACATTLIVADVGWRVTTAYDYGLVYKEVWSRIGQATPLFAFATWATALYLALKFVRRPSIDR